MTTQTKLLTMLGGGVLAASMALGAGQAQVVAPTDPDLAELLGLDTGTVFVLKPGQPQVRFDFDRERAVEVCVVTGTTPAFNSLPAKLVAQDEEMTLDIGECGVISGTDIAVMPALEMGGNQRVKGYYRIVG